MDAGNVKAICDVPRTARRKKEEGANEKQETQISGQIAVRGDTSRDLGDHTTRQKATSIRGCE